MENFEHNPALNPPVQPEIKNPNQAEVIVGTISLVATEVLRDIFNLGRDLLKCQNKEDVDRVLGPPDPR